TDSDAGALPESVLGCLINSLVRKRARAGNDPYRALLVNEARHDPDLALVRSDHSGTVGPHEACPRPGEHGLHAHHIVDGHTFGDTDNELDPGVSCLEN